MGGWDQNGSQGDWLVGWFWIGTVTGSCEYSNVPLGSDATDLVSYY
jgi:hypothetical protein